MKLHEHQQPVSPPGRGAGTVDGVATMVGRVVVFVQENHTTDNYFRSMRAYGGNVAADCPLQPNPPTHDQAPHPAAYARWLHAQHARDDVGN